MKPKVAAAFFICLNTLAVGYAIQNGTATNPPPLAVVLYIGSFVFAALFYSP